MKNNILLWFSQSFALSSLSFGSLENFLIASIGSGLELQESTSSFVMEEFALKPVGERGIQ